MNGFEFVHEETATERMREALGAKGVECRPTRFSTLQTAFEAGGVEWIVTEREATGELFMETRRGITCEQAVAAALGLEAGR